MAKPLVAKDLSFKRPNFKVLYVEKRVDADALELALKDGYQIGNVSALNTAIVYVLVKNV
jgi:hypothetical protein